jgi:Ca2+-binding RTX toxin-like protein
MRRRFRTLAVICLLALAATSGIATANTSHAGWPSIDGMLLMNKHDQDRPLDGRPGSDPFDGFEASEACHGPYRNTQCVPDGISVAAPAHGVTCDTLAAAVAGLVALLPPAARATPACPPSPLATVALVPPGIGHNELLGGHGNDTIHAGPAGDVIWGDYKPSGQPTTQVDHLYGGPGNDFIYASHGTNYIYTGGGRDIIHAHFGHGEIHCDSAGVTVYLSRRSRRRYKLFGCRHISYKTLGY